MSSIRILCGLVLCLALAGCGKKAEKPLRDPYVCEPVRICSAYIALLEKPDAERTLLIGENARNLAPYLTHAGTTCFTALDGSFDLIVADCARMSKDAFASLRDLLTPEGVVAWLIDVRDLTMDELRRRMSVFELYDVHLWMPGQDHWLLIGCKKARTVRLAAMLELFAWEETFADLAKARSGTLPELFANYVGSAEDFAGAFSANGGDRPVRPECFLPQKIPTVNWISADAVDADILKGITDEIRSLQLVRRLAVEGAMRAQAIGGDANAATNGIDFLARAAARNRNDLFVVERLDRLDRNARGFLSMGKILLAMKCYETMVLIQPLDAAAVHNFGLCLKKIGKTELADEVLQRAQTLIGNASTNAPPLRASTNAVPRAAKAPPPSPAAPPPPLPSGSRYR